MAQGQFTLQAKNGTDSLKSGTVPINFVRKYLSCSGSIGAYGPRTAQVFEGFSGHAEFPGDIKSLKMPTSKFGHFLPPPPFEKI